uniref:ATP-binding cassette domain-containing protein n=1 Tax=Nocardia farcinica TaxID=37329 RepID=UPI002454D026
MAKRIDVKDLNIYYGKFHAVADVSLTVLPRSVTAFIGPSGCGKSTVLRSLNRMHEVTPNARGGGRGGRTPPGATRHRSRWRSWNRLSATPKSTRCRKRCGTRFDTSSPPRTSRTASSPP